MNPERLNPFRRLPVGLFLFVLLASPTGAMALDDRFVAGYATALLEHEFGLESPTLEVRDGVITLKAPELEGIHLGEVITALSKIDGVVRVEISDPRPDITNPPAIFAHGSEPPLGQAEPAGSEDSPSNPVILPKGRLFDPLIADPRWPHFSATYQHYIDDPELRTVGATSFGETLGLYRDDAPFEGEWQLDIQAAVFAIFDLDAKSYDLVNADYWVGFPVTYRRDNFSALLRIFHQSSHLGDEYLLRNQIERDNLSYEAVDLSLSYEFMEAIRVYGGGGYLYHRVPSDLDPRFIQYGLEFKCPWALLGGIARPVAGLNFKNIEEHDWDTEVSLRLGIQLESAKTRGHKIQFMVEYFSGHSPNGQFYERSIEYIGAGAHFYF